MLWCSDATEDDGLCSPLDLVGCHFHDYCGYNFSLGRTPEDAGAEDRTMGVVSYMYLAKADHRTSHGSLEIYLSTKIK
jgi:hypothetical protein